MDDRPQWEEKNNKKKEVLALSKAQYRSVQLYETTRGVGIFLGVWYFTFDALQKATKFIDDWFDMRKN